MTDLLVRHLLESTLLCVVRGSLTYCLQRQAAAVRHSIWLISVLKFSLPSAMLAVTGAWVAFVLPAGAWVSFVAAKLSVLLAAMFGLLPTHISPDGIAFVSFSLEAFWGIGSAILFGTWLSRLRKSHDGFSASTNKEAAALDRAKRRLGFRRTVRLRCAEGSKTPALAGILRPTVVIPRGLSEILTPTEFEAILLHELAHARRRHNLVSAFVHCLVCIFWFHPLLWLVEQRLIAERKRACDEIVMDSGILPEIYLAGLVKVCQYHLLGEPAGVSAASGSNLGARLDRILSYRASQPIPMLHV